MHRDTATFQDWVDARVRAMFLLRSAGFEVLARDWPPVWQVPIPLTDDEAQALRWLSYLREAEALDDAADAT